MNEGMARLQALLAAGTPVVRMAVAGVRGSAPREAGATLLYWRDTGGQVHSQGSVGGGRLEEQCMAIARFLLDPDASIVPGGSLPRLRRRVERFTLGASLGQCCGGVVQMYWERFDEPEQARALLQPAAGTGDDGATLRYCALDGSDREYLVGTAQVEAHGLPAPVFTGRAGLLQGSTGEFFVERLGDDATALWLYGAGHVGRALVHVLADLPFVITWVDSRSEMLSEAMAQLAPARRERVTPSAEDPDFVCTGAPRGAWHLVMTHCHDQDLRVCARLLSDAQFGFLGLIGSRTKAARFRHALRNRGFPPDRIALLLCPIGVDGIRDKRPAAIAIAVAAQLLQQRALEPSAAAPAREPGLDGYVPHG